MRGFALVMAVCLMAIVAAVVAAPAAVSLKAVNGCALSTPRQGSQVAIKMFRRRSCSGGRCG
jgi:hypothetical protein